MGGWKRLAVVVAAAAACSGAACASLTVPDPAPVSAAHAVPSTAPIAPALMACQIPVITLGHEKGNTPGGGILSLPDGTYQTDPASGLSYDAAFHRWLPVDPELVATDGTSYAQLDGDSVWLVDVASGTRRPVLRSADATGRWVPRRYTAEGVYLDRIAGQSGLGAGLALLTSDGRLTPVDGTSRRWDVIGPGAAWAAGASANPAGPPDQVLFRLDLADRSAAAWYHPPAGTRRLYVLGADAGGRPLVVFRADPPAPWRLGLVTGRDALSEVPQPAGLQTASGFGFGFTDGRGIWLGLDGAGLALYGRDGTFTMVSTVPANVERAAGPCADLHVGVARPPATPARPPATPATPPATPAQTPVPPPATPAVPARATVAVPFQHQQSSLSCEEAALSMVLAFYGHPTSEQEVFAQVGIDRTHYWAGRPGGGDPYLQFVGDPNGSEVQQTGYGVYWPPIKAAGGHFGAPVAQAGEGIAPAAIYGAVRAGHPAVVWVTYDLRAHPRADYRAYDGRTIPYAGAYEHAMVVTGVDGTGVRVNDPDAGQYWVPYGQFETAYAVYGEMAVVFG